MIQTPWYSKDHSSQNLSETETTQSLTKFFKNNIFHIRWKLCRWNEKKKNRKLKKLPILAKISKHVTSYVLATWRSAVKVVQWLRPCLHGGGGPRSSGVGFFCFVFSGAWKQKKPTPLDRVPPLHVNRVLDGFPLYFWPSERRPDIKRSPKKSNLRTFMSVANLSLGAPPR